LALLESKVDWHLLSGTVYVSVLFSLNSLLKGRMKKMTIFYERASDI